MSSNRSLTQILDSLASSSNYCQRIELNTTMGHFYQFKCEYQLMLNQTQILPPCVWFAIEEGQCLSSILNDVEKSRTSREGLLSTIQKGNLLNRINYHELEEDIGTIQQTEQSFCVSFSVVKDNNNDYLKHIGSQLRSCLTHKTNLINRQHLKLGISEKIPNYIYSKFRIFLIFDVRSYHDKILSIQSCFYPNVRFTIERIKKKKQFKFASNEVLKNIQNGEYINDFGFLSLDSKTRLLLIQKDDPDLHKENLIGVWIISSYPTKRTRKQFGKQDAIWTALLDYYTNPSVQSKVSIIVQNKGFLIYFCFRKEKNKIDSPEYYLFEPITQPMPKWSFLTKSEFINDWKKPFEVKMDFVNNIIIQQRQFSQISDQINPAQQVPKPQPQPITKQTYPRQSSSKPTKPNQTIINESVISGGSSQGQTKTVNKNNEDDEDQKNKIIAELKTEVEKYKMKCVELETINKMLMQEKMMNNNHMIYSGQYQQPIMYYGQIPTFPYPIPYSQTNQAYPPLPQNQFSLQQQHNKPSEHLSYSQTQNYPPISPKKSTQSQKTSPLIKSIQQISLQNEKQNHPLFLFPEIQQQDFTFGGQKNSLQQNKGVESKDKSFHKKYQPYSKQQLEQHDKNNCEKSDEEQEKYTQIHNKQKIKDIHPKKDIRNISFQDSFLEYHSDHEEEAAKFKSSEYDSLKNTKNYNQQLQQKLNQSPQFKKIQSLPLETHPLSQIHSQNMKDHKNQDSLMGKQTQNKANQKWKNTENLANEPSKSKQIKNKQPQPKLPISTKQQSKQKNSQKIHAKPLESSNESEQQSKQKKLFTQKSKCIEKQKIQSKNQYEKPIYHSDDSDDSDEDSKFKQIKQNYLKR